MKTYLKLKREVIFKKYLSQQMNSIIKNVDKIYLINCWRKEYFLSLKEVKDLFEWVTKPMTINIVEDTFLSRYSFPLSEYGFLTGEVIRNKENGKYASSREEVQEVFKPFDTSLNFQTKELDKKSICNLNEVSFSLENQFIELRKDIVFKEYLYQEMNSFLQEGDKINLLKKWKKEYSLELKEVKELYEWVIKPMTINIVEDTSLSRYSFSNGKLIWNKDNGKYTSSREEVEEAFETFDVSLRFQMIE